MDCTNIPDDGPAIPSIRPSMTGFLGFKLVPKAVIRLFTNGLQSSLSTQTLSPSESSK